jgi:hypothetical protein
MSKAAGSKSWRRGKREWLSYNLVMLLGDNFAAQNGRRESETVLGKQRKEGEKPEGGKAILQDQAVC